MSKSMPDKSIRTLGYVLRRTNYGEADRILNIITPLGKISAIARGVRKEKSKLAGGIELFSLTDYNIHAGRGELGVVTGAKMLKHYGEILKDYARMELASEILKEINRVADSSDSEEYYNLVDQGLSALNEAVDARLVRGWFVLSLMRIMGEEVNLYRDVDGEKLMPDKFYEWDVGDKGFREGVSGGYGADEIKMLRLMATAKMDLLKRVKIEEGMMVKLMGFVNVVK